MKSGRKIYCDLSTGNIIIDTAESSGWVVETTTEQDCVTYSALAERVPETVGVLKLEYGEYAEDFVVCNGYIVDIGADEPALVFSYPDESREPEPESVYQPPLSQRIDQLEQEQADLLFALIEGGVL